MRAAILALGLVGCPHPAVIQQVRTTSIVEQVGVVPAPAAPLAIGAPLERGQAMVLGGGTWAMTQGEAPRLGQRIAPLLGVGRVASGVSDRNLELAVSGAAGPASGALFPGERAGPAGVVGRGDLGLRAWVPLRHTDLEWGWSVDAGAVASVYRRTERTVLEAWSIGRPTVVQESSVTLPDALRVHPDLRVGTVLRVPIADVPASAVLGLEGQTWPVYWASDQASTTCTTWSTGLQECATAGSVAGHPTNLVGVLTPSIGGAWRSEDFALHVQAFAHLGASAVGRVPGGLVVMLERRTPVVPR